MKLMYGFSLIELMISSVLSLLLLAGVIKLYHNHQALYRHQENLMLVQENARMLLHMLHTGIQSAGYIGCGRIDNIKIYPASKKLLSPEMIIRDDNKNDIYPGTDALIVRHMNTQTAEFVSVPKKGETNISLTTDKGFKSGDVIVIADCAQMQTAKIIQQYNNRMMIDPPIQYVFSEQAQIGRLIESRFFLADSGRHNSRGEPIISFYWADGSRSKLASEMIEGVEKMSVRYGILLSNGIQYQTASQVKDWSKVRTMQIALSLTNQDAGFRRTWETQITLRALL